MQYSRRRIQRVSGVTIRDERIEGRDFSTPAVQESAEEGEASPHERVPRRRLALFERIDKAHRERT